jgi:hypothetical protein
METSTYDQQAIDFLASTQTKFTSDFKEFGSMPWDKDGAKRNIFTITLQNGKHAYSFCFGSSINDSCKETKRAKIQNEGETDVFTGFAHMTGDKYKVIFSHTIKTTFATLRAIQSGEKDYSELLNIKTIENDFNEYLKSIKTYNGKKLNFGHGPTVKGYDIDEIYSRIRKRISETIKELSEEQETFHTDQADEIVHPSAYDVLTCLTKYDPGTFENFCSEFGYDTDSRSAVRTYKSVRKEWNAVSKLFTETEIEQLQEIQ